MARQIRIVVRIVIAAALLLSTVALHAQQATPEATSSSENNIIYLVAEALSPAEAGMRAPERVAEALPVHVVFTWEEFIKLEAEQPVDALLIDVSALDEVDAEWLASAYRNGVPIAAFNLTMDQFAELVDDRLLTLSGFTTDYPGDFFFMASSHHAVCTQDPEATEEAGRRGQTTSSGSRSSATNTLDTREDLQFFADLLLRQIEDIEKAHNGACATAAGET